MKDNFYYGDIDYYEIIECLDQRAGREKPLYRRTLQAGERYGACGVQTDQARSRILLQRD